MTIISDHFAIKYYFEWTIFNGCERFQRNYKSMRMNSIIFTGLKIVKFVLTREQYSENILENILLEQYIGMRTSYQSIIKYEIVEEIFRIIDLVSFCLKMRTKKWQ